MRFSVLLMARIFVVAGVALALPAAADDACNRSAGDAAIAACTRIIEDGGTSTKDRAAAFYNRGIAYRGKGQFDRAIQDYDEAIRLNPNNASAFFMRGNAYAGKDQYDRAIEDYDRAIRL